MNFNKHKKNDDEQWLPVSDLMAGLMMVFLFIAIALMRSAYLERDKIKEVAVTYQENQVALYDQLILEFESDLKKWDAEIDRNSLTFTFKSPEILFDRGETKLKSKFKKVLEDFFPRYLGVVYKFKDSIDEIRIEGHTSSVWNSGTSLDHSYFNNMWLSQGRTRSVLEFVHNIDEVKDEKQWIKSHIAAVGYSFSKLIVKPNGTEDKERSRRVSFRVITNAETQIRKILEVE